MAQSRPVQVRLAQKTYERLVEFCESAGFISTSGRPIVSQAVLKMIRKFLDTHNAEEWENLREEFGGDTFEMLDVAVREYLRKRRRVNF